MSGRGPEDAEAKPRLLLVDDDALVRAGLERLLSRELGVATETSAEAALLRLERQHFDVVLSDFNMTGQSGAWLLRQAKDRWPSMRRVLMSSGDVPELDALLREGVVEAFFRKLDVPQGLVAWLCGARR